MTLAFNTWHIYSVTSFNISQTPYHVASNAVEGYLGNFFSGQSCRITAGRVDIPAVRAAPRRTARTARDATCTSRTNPASVARWKFLFGMPSERPHAVTATRCFPRASRAFALLAKSRARQPLGFWEDFTVHMRARVLLLNKNQCKGESTGKGSNELLPVSEPREARPLPRCLRQEDGSALRR